MWRVSRKKRLGKPIKTHKSLKLKTLLVFRMYQKKSKSVQDNGKRVIHTGDMAARRVVITHTHTTATPANGLACLSTLLRGKETPFTNIKICYGIQHLLCLTVCEWEETGNKMWSVGSSMARWIRSSLLDCGLASQLKWQKGPYPYGIFSLSRITAEYSINNRKAMFTFGERVSKTCKCTLELLIYNIYKFVVYINKAFNYK